MKTLYKFHANWCQPCQTLKANLDFLFKNEKDKLVEFAVVDVNIEDNPQLAQEHKVRSVPTLVITDELGIESSRLIGGAALPELRKFLGLSPTTFSDDLPGNMG